MFVTFFQELKAAGLPVTLREFLTLMQAMEKDLADRRGHVFRVTAAREQRAHSFAARLDGPRDLEPQHCRFARGWWVAAGDLRQVGAVHP